MDAANAQPSPTFKPHVIQGTSTNGKIESPTQTATFRGHTISTNPDVEIILVESDFFQNNIQTRETENEEEMLEKSVEVEKERETQRNQEKSEAHSAAIHHVNFVNVHFKNKIYKFGVLSKTDQNNKFLSKILRKLIQGIIKAREKEREQKKMEIADQIAREAIHRDTLKRDMQNEEIEKSGLKPNL